MSRRMQSTSSGSPLTISMGTSPDGSVSQTYEYRLAEPRSGMTDEEKRRLQDRFDELKAEKIPVYDEKVRQKEMNENEAAAALAHDVLGQLAAEFRLGYCRVLRRVGFLTENK